MKGIILAGGSGSRLFPATLPITKQLLDIGGKPMIYYPLTQLMLAGIRDIMIISSPRDIGLYQRCLGNGHQWGIALTYAVQPRPAGIAQAFFIPSSPGFTSSIDFIGTDSVTLILGDNIFFGPIDYLLPIREFKSGALLFAKHVSNPERFGVIQFDSNDTPVQILEKPSPPPSHFAVTGLYCYDSRVIEHSVRLTPSPRGELEITDLNNRYLHDQQAVIIKLRRGVAWFDTGTKEAIQHVRQFIYLQESLQEVLIGSPEEVAYRMNFIDNDQLEALLNTYPDNEYTQLLKKVIKE
ncbi:MAG: NTP transferase domain-containing protein [Candidatus Delongbacteria bacterium]|nr:NTP transferase domain-containing protein [Candidatus Delongbacteria bacterium]